MIRTSAFAFALMCLSPIKAHAEIHVSWNCERGASRETCAAKGGLEYIYIYGYIDREVAQVISNIDGLLPINAIISKVYLNSGGGLIVSALHVGRILRRRGAEVTTFNALQPEYYAECASACSIIAAGAVTRNLNSVGLHSGYRVERRNGKEQIFSLSEAATALDEEYFLEMGMSPRVNEISRETPPQKIAEFSYDPDKPLEEQEIFKLGFRMHPADSEEAARIKSLVKQSSKERLFEQYKKGDAIAAFKLAEHYFNGRDGTLDIQQGLMFLDKASVLGNRTATHNLAVAYANGRYGLQVDKKKAVSLYLVAAKSGFAESQNNLGWMYYKGEGTAKNISEAIYWVTRAAEQGEPFAYGSLGTIRFDGNGFRRDYVETYKWLSMAVRHLPEGDARNEDEGRLKKLIKLMTDKQLREGEAAIVHWNKTRQTVPRMKDKYNF